MQSSLGCEAKSRQLIDHATNTHFSETIDDALGEAFVVIRTFLGFESRRRKPLTAQPVAGDYALRTDGKPVLSKRGRPWAVEERADDSRHFTIAAPNVERAKELIEHALASERLTRKDVKELSAYSVSDYAPPMQFNLVLCDPFVSRALAKAAFNLFVTIFGNSIALTNQFDELRHYILQAVDHYQVMRTQPDPALRHMACWEQRDDLFASIPYIFQTPFQHNLVVRASPKTATAYALIQLFGHLRYSVLLSDEWTRDDICAGLFADPTIENRRCEIKPLACDLCPALSAADVLAHKNDFKTGEDRLKCLFTALYKRIEEKQNSEMIMTALADTGLVPADGRPITQTDTNRLSQRVAELFVNRQFRLGSKIPLDPASI